MRFGAGMPREYDLRVEGEGKGRYEVPSLCNVCQLPASTTAESILGSHYQHRLWARYSFDHQPQ